MIYLDHAATTPLDPRVRDAMLPFLNENWGNPSSIHQHGQRARHAVDSARETIATELHCQPREIIFTSGGTEADNLALRGVMRAGGATTGHLITTTIEHHAVLHTAEDLEKDGFEVTYLPVDKHGLVTVEQVEAAIRTDTKLVSVMLANNEVGTIEPIRDIGKILQKRRERGETAPLLHTDAVQGAGAINLDVRHLKVDLLSLSAHKCYGPKGIGCLFVKHGVQLRPMQTGGGQEHHQRAGTEHVTGIVGFAAALQSASEARETEAARQTELRDYFIVQLQKEIAGTQLLGHPTQRLPNNICMSFAGIESESLLLRLDLAGICASSGSACTSGALEPSHVLLAMGIGTEAAHSAIRFTLGKNTTKEELDTTVKEIKKITGELRQLNDKTD